MTAENFFIKAGYQARTQPEYHTDVHDDGVIWQPEVHPLAAILAQQYECRYIIDIGCGRARKLAALHPEFEIMGLDSGGNLEYCRAQYSFGKWIDVDLEHGMGVEIPPEILRNAVIISSGVIERLVDPARLLQTIRSYLVHARVALVATPERDLERGPDDMGPPANTAHVREWNLAELETLLGSEELRPVYCGLTRSNDKDKQRFTSLAIVPGLSLDASHVRDLGAFCEQWLAASPEQRRAAKYLHQLAQLEMEAEQAKATAQKILATPSPLEIGTRHIDNGRYDEAFQVLTDALRAKPDPAAIAPILFQLGRLAAARQLNDDAKELFYQAAMRDVEVIKDVIDFYIDQVARSRSGQQ